MEKITLTIPLLIDDYFGTNGAFCVSSGSGATWVNRTSTVPRMWQCISSSANWAKLAAAVEGGFIYTSEDSGVTWTERTGAGSHSWGAIASSADGAKLVATTLFDINFIYASADTGLIWVKQKIDANAGEHIAGVACSASGTKFAAVANNGLICTAGY